ncbi:hypothetical protein W97_07875 [Coniosporium apollinis CBS 100218]|uniref:Phospholipase A2 n=1 Tax=Coniosporium apollinis (strain CBS 100218) TaxID=1168221 RepID=R7Z3A2_CONA1|nr:uncharacterized protein W97_07875 [Coniosporium apollinis CBS 100218]EON68617.1 hypothetical protein W97_07875 [Coniosporium apollinis CBS 100218]
MHFLKAVAFGLSLAASVSALAIGDIKDGLNHLVARGPVQDTDRLLYSTSMSNFLAAKRAKNPSYLNWNDDGCSILSDTPYGFNFLPSCQRHDFGYRNYKAQNRCSSDDRKRVDQKFLSDMNNECGKQSAVKKLACLKVASEYYVGVRAAGGLKWC